MYENVRKGIPNFFYFLFVIIVFFLQKVTWCTSG